jgi:predicted ArsR family transcriptional regulator
VNRLDALGDPGLRSTLLFIRAQGQPVVAAEVAERLDIPRSAARWRLERLAGKGLLVTGFERRSGRSGPGAGRPAKTYAAAPETAAIEFPRRHYETLISSLIGALPHPKRPKQLGRVGYEFGIALAAAAGLRRTTSFPRALERLCRALGRLGFQATVDSVSEGKAVIVSATCPLRPLVRADAAARAIDEGMWRGLVAAAAGEEAATRLTCRTHNCLDDDAPCRIVLTFLSGSGRVAVSG